MVLCWAPDCKHYNVRETCKFFKFSVDGKERNRWKKLVRRIEEPGPGAFICSCHFKDGKRENGPTLFAHNEMTTFGEHHLSPEKKQSRPSDTTTTANQGLFVESSGGCPGLEVNVEVANIPSTSSACFTSPSLLEAENFFLKKDYDEASQKLENLSSRFGYEHIAKDDAMILLNTGLPNSTIFLASLEMLQDVEINYYLGWKVESINRTDQLLLTLMKLRQNFPYADLAQRFKCSKATVTNIVITWIHVMYDTLYLQLMENIPSRGKNVSCLPSSFATFTNCRIIIDCTEIGTAIDRKSMSKQKATYSSYKHKNTWKGLVGVAPNGVVTFVSSLYPGSSSDKQIVQKCGILRHLEPGDIILADKGFLIRDILPAGVTLNIPPFLTTPQFTPEQVRRTECIAKARIHVERAIRRMKCYKILDFIPKSLLSYADNVFKVVAALTNLQYSLIKEVQQYYGED